MKTPVWGQTVPTGPASWTTEENYVAVLSRPPMETVSDQHISTQVVQEGSLSRKSAGEGAVCAPRPLRNPKAKVSRARKLLGSLGVG